MITEEQIEELVYELKHSKTGIGWTIKGDEENNEVERIVRKHLEGRLNPKIAELQAKIFVYEQIISKSNFAPMFDKFKRLDNEEPI